MIKRFCIGHETHRRGKNKTGRRFWMKILISDTVTEAGITVQDLHFLKPKLLSMAFYRIKDRS